MDNSSEWNHGILSSTGCSSRNNDGSGRCPGSKLGGARVVSADGTVSTLLNDFDPNKLRAMLTANGEETMAK